MEKDLFDWKKWDNYGNLLSFEDCTLKREIGDHKPGEVIPYIVWDTDSGLLELVVDPKNNVEEQYEVEMIVTKRVS